MVGAFGFVAGAVIGFAVGVLWALMNLDDIEDAEFEEWEAMDYGDVFKD